MCQAIAAERDLHNIPLNEICRTAYQGKHYHILIDEHTKFGRLTNLPNAAH